jgi:hypothetical protein
LNKLERKFGKYYIPNLMAIITAGCAASFLLSYIFGNGVLSVFTLDPSKILQGEVWRLITFIFITPNGSFWYLITIYFYYIAGRALESVWGGFKFNVYYFVGVISAIIIAFINLLVFKSFGVWYVATIMNLSLLFAYAKVYPDTNVWMYFIIPVKLKYLGYLTWLIILGNFIKSLINKDVGAALFSLVPVISYLLFFLKSNYRQTKMRTGSVIRMKDYKKKINSTKKSYIHKCVTCGITNVDDTDMEFRYCSKCNGKHCYCSKHILDHVHVE